MKALDWTEIYRQYRGKWVSFGQDHETVVRSGNTLKSAGKHARKQRITQQRTSAIPSAAQMPNLSKEDLVMSTSTARSRGRVEW